MKYYTSSNPYLWNHCQNSTQNSSSNIRVCNNVSTRTKQNRKKRKESCYSSASSHQYSISSYSTEEKGHYQFFEGEVLGGIYQVTKLMGEGTFGRVVEAEANLKKYAIKIIRPVDRYIHSAKIQKNIIKQINSKDIQDKEGIVKYVHSFYHRSNFCLVFKPLGKSLYEVIKMNQFQGFPMYLVKTFFKQILQSIGFLHKIGYTHTDLKPENILLEEQDLLKIQGFTEETRQIYLPKSQKIRIIDFGGATKYSNFHSSVICTRQYRPPEVILKCCQWNQIADVWSIGCIIFELVTGNLLFQTHEDFEHLIMIQKNSGKFPFWMIKKSEQDFRDVFEYGEISPTKAEKYFNNWRNINNLKTVSQIISDQNLKDLLNQCLEIDPNKRITCRSALDHRFFK